MTKLWTKPFTINCVTNLLIYLIYYLMLVITVPYAIDSLHASPSIAGLASGLFVCGAMIARLGLGRNVNAIGMKKLLTIGLIAYLLTTCLYFFAHSLLVLCLVRLLNGIAFGMSALATGSINVNIIPRERQGEGVSFYSLSTIFASAIGPFVGLYLHQHSVFHTVITLCLVLVLLCLAASFLLRVPGNTAGSKPSCLNKRTRLSLGDFVEKKAIPISLICFLGTFGYSSILSFLSKFAESTNRQSILTASTYFFLIYSIAIFLSRPFTGRLFDRKGANTIMYPAIVLYAAGLLLLGLTQHGFMLLIAAALVGLGYGSFLSISNAIAVRPVPPDRLPLATSTFFVFADLGAGIGPFLLGLMIPGIISFREMYLLSAGLVALLLLAYHFVQGRKESLFQAVRQAPLTDVTGHSK